MVRGIPSQSRQIRVDNRAVAVGSAIPDANHIHYAADQPESDAQTVTDWDDSQGSLPLTGDSSGTLQGGSVNNTDAINLDGSSVAYDYGSNLSSNINAPMTLIWSLNLNSLPSSGIVTFWRDPSGTNSGKSRLYMRTDNNYTAFQINGTVDFSAPVPSKGDLIISIRVGGGSATYRVNGSDQSSVSGLATNATVLDKSVDGGYYARVDSNDRYIDGQAIESRIYDEKLTGAKLQELEETVEDRANMNVL